MFDLRFRLLTLSCRCYGGYIEVRNWFILNAVLNVIGLTVRLQSIRLQTVRLQTVRLQTVNYKLSDYKLSNYMIGSQLVEIHGLFNQPH